jgi:hypothetical protein
MRPCGATSLLPHARRPHGYVRFRTCVARGTAHRYPHLAHVDSQARTCKWMAGQFSRQATAPPHVGGSFASVMHLMEHADMPRETTVSHTTHDVRIDNGACRACRARWRVVVPRERGAGRADGTGPPVSVRAGRSGAPDRSRTCDLWLRKPTLYPTELRAQAGILPRAPNERPSAGSRPGRATYNARLRSLRMGCARVFPAVPFPVPCPCPSLRPSRPCSVASPGSSYGCTSP